MLAQASQFPSLKASADNAEGEHRRASALPEIGDLVPVEVVGVGLRHTCLPQGPSMLKATRRDQPT